MYICICHIGRLLAIELVDTGEYFMVSGWDDLEHKRSPTEIELREIEYHKVYLSQLYGGRDGS